MENRKQWESLVKRHFDFLSNFGFRLDYVDEKVAGDERRLSLRRARCGGDAKRGVRRVELTLLRLVDAKPPEVEVWLSEHPLHGRCAEHYSGNPDRSHGVTIGRALGVRHSFGLTWPIGLGSRRVRCWPLGGGECSNLRISSHRVRRNALPRRGSRAVAILEGSPTCSGSRMRHTAIW